MPGSGKTLSAVEALAAMIARWEKHPAEARSIFCHNVTDLALPHASLPLKSVTIAKVTYDVPDWALVPDGSYILIDECQKIFPPRASGAVMPEHVDFLNTHRHRGFDITLITQHPRLIDTAVRALVGKHQHFRRLFGRQIAVCYEWDSCSDSLGGLANAVMSKYSFPKKAFQWYKSAEVHTKQNFRLPKWLLIPVLGLVMGAFAFPMAYKRVTGMADTGKLKSSISTAGGVAPVPAASASGLSVVGATAAPGPVPPVGLVVPPELAYAGCVATPKKCACYDKGGIKVEVEDDVCREHIAGLSSPGQKADISGVPSMPDSARAAGDADVFSFMQRNRKPSL